MRILFSSLWFGLIFGSSFDIKPNSYETFESKVLIDARGRCKVFDYSSKYLVGLNQNNPVKLHRSKLAHFEGETVPKNLSKTTVVVQGLNQTVVDKELDKLCTTITHAQPSLRRRGAKVIPYTEVRKLLSSGDSKNRIDIVFMGDGYQIQEKEKFFKDIDKLMVKLFDGVTFQSYLPLYNVWGVFVESKDSGITKGTLKKDTAFQLYRPGEELRAIYYDEETIPNLTRAYCSLTGPFGCDYRVIIANDEFYGGLGGDIIISTSSQRSGSVVLNHEMGHTFADVGDEYDNSYAYFGSNSQDWTTDLNQVKWSHWIDGPIQPENSMNRLLLYPWYDLGKGSYAANFTSDGLYASWFLRSGLSGMDIDSVLKMELDGKLIPWKSPNTVDRVFFEHRSTTPLTQGNHTLKFTQLKPPQPNQPKRMVTSITLHEYGKDYPFQGEKYSLFPTWDDHGIKRYRPTNEFCVMRNVTSPNFCKVCKESLWLQYFQRISLIDSLQSTSLVNNTHVQVVKLKVNCLGLGQFRSVPKLGELISFSWFRDGMEQPKLKGLHTILIKKEVNCTKNSTWKVLVKFISPEVRKDEKNLLTATAQFTF